MAAKIRLHLPLQGFDLLVQDGDHRDQGADGDGVGVGDGRRLAQLGAAQRRQDDAALAGMSRRRARLRAADICARVSFAAFAGSGAFPSSSSASGAARSSKASSAAWSTPQLVAQPLHLPGPFPDQRLMGTRHHLDRPRARAVARHRAQLAGIGAHHVGQHVRVAGIALGAGHAVAFPYREACSGFTP